MKLPWIHRTYVFYATLAKSKLDGEIYSTFQRLEPELSESDIKLLAEDFTDFETVKLETTTRILE